MELPYSSPLTRWGSRHLRMEALDETCLAYAKGSGIAVAPDMGMGSMLLGSLAVAAIGTDRGRGPARLGTNPLNTLNYTPIPTRTVGIVAARQSTIDFHSIKLIFRVVPWQKCIVE